MKQNTAIPYEIIAKTNPEILEIDIKGATFLLEGKEVSLGIMDKNKNNKFDDYGIDVLCVGRGQLVNARPVISSNASIMKKVNLLKIDSNYYEINILNGGKKCLLNRKKKVVGTSFSEDITLITKIPDIDLPLILKDSMLNLSELKDNKNYILFEFWSTWCAPCIDAMNEYKSKRIERLDIVSLISESDNLKLARKIINENEYSWDFVVCNASYRKLFSQTGYPFSVLFSPTGEILFSGYLSLEEIEDVMNVE